MMRLLLLVLTFLLVFCFANADQAEEFVESALATKKVVLFTKSYCPHSKIARAIFAKYRLPSDDYEYIDIDGRDDMDEIQDYLLFITGNRTVPRVFISGQFIGGADETAKLDESGELRMILKSVGLIL